MILTVHVQPNAKRSEVVTWLDETTVKIKISAPAVDGKANKALLEFLRELFQAKNVELELVRGRTTRMKQVRVDDRRWDTFRQSSSIKT